MRPANATTRRTHRRPITGVALAAGALLLTACASPGQDQPNTATGCAIPEGPMAYAVGGRANMPAVSGTPALAASVSAAATNQATVTLLDTGGSPTSQGQFELSLQANNNAARQREAQQNAKMLAQQVMAVAATAPEANPLEALNRAADSVRSAPGGEQGGTVVLVDSGLQTTGALDYTEPGILAADPQDVVEALTTSGQLPDLSGMTVILVGIGQTAPPQEPLDAGKRHNVAQHWRALVESAGAACVAFDDTQLTATSNPGLPEVTAFPVPKVENTIPTASTPVYLRDEVMFKSNSAEYIDPQRAAGALRPIAAWMKDSGSAVTLTGTTATDGTPEGRKQLSLMRAESVKASLIALGADASHITTRGAGSEHLSHVNDLGPNGELLPGPAAQNRMVIVEVAA